MALVMTPIYTQTASGSSNTVTFNNIPQHFTDLKLALSVRSTATGSLTGGFVDSSYITFNGSTANSSWTFIYGYNSGVTSSRGGSPTILYLGPLNGANSTSSTFTSGDIYVPNYTGSNFKSGVVDLVTENNGTLAFISMLSHLCRTTSAITSLSVIAGEGNWAANSTFSLYGIIRSGA